jgi:hypothetical protein
VPELQVTGAMTDPNEDRDGILAVECLPQVAERIDCSSQHSMKTRTCDGREALRSDRVSIGTRSREFRAKAARCCLAATQSRNRAKRIAWKLMADVLYRVAARAEKL